MESRPRCGLRFPHAIARRPRAIPHTPIIPTCVALECSGRRFIGSYSRSRQPPASSQGVRSPAPAARPLSLSARGIPPLPRRCALHILSHARDEPGGVLRVHLAQDIIGQENAVDAPSALLGARSDSVWEVLVIGFEKAKEHAVMPRFWLEIGAEQDAIRVPEDEAPRGGLPAQLLVTRRGPRSS